MIVVTGAGGQLGHAIVTSLLQRGSVDRIIASVRDPGKAADLAARGVEVRVGDFADPGSLKLAFEGADQVLIVSADKLGDEALRLTAKSPVIHLRIVLERAFGSVFLLSLSAGAALYGVSYVVPQFLNQLSDYNAFQSGQITFIIGVPSVLLMPLFPLLERRVDIRLLVGSGLALYGAGCLMNAQVRVLANEAVERGPVAVVGIDDGFTGHADIGMSLAAASVLTGARVVLTHTPDTAEALPRGSAALVLAGHTHCGQAVFPLIGPVVINSPRLHRPLYDPRYRCGLIRDPERTVIVTGGIGASLPLRFGAPPDIWLLTLGP